MIMSVDAHCLTLFPLVYYTASRNGGGVDWGDWEFENGEGSEVVSSGPYADL